MTPDPHSFSLETDRLILRPLTQTDAAPLTRLLNDFEVSKWLSRIPYPYGVIEMQWFIARLNSPYRFGIVHKGTGRIMGVIGIAEHLGYWLGQPHWRHGYMLEAAQAVVDHWFAHDGLSLASYHFVENAKSRAILKRLGFEDTQRMRQNCVARGEPREAQCMILTREAWSSRQSPDTGPHNTAHDNAH